ncbi:maleylpyruvate isomerase N-terminal domain-containing protein [Streptomyces sp. NPDC059070]|uniref:maleylpyruvate isomerase N-terminal domain-containing protein n=1 Tax=Streptomyces sp. NPDC059070 TaxID=3346713 RepID=UPI0036A393EB
MSEALEQALAEALASLVAAVDTCEEDVLDPDTAVKWLEGSAYILDRLAPADRRRLAGLFRAAALREPAGPWRDDLLKVGDGFGLDEDQHELYCDAVESAVRRFVEAVRTADPAAPVPSCPGWAFADLTRHHGTTHRWITHLVEHRVSERVWPREVRLDVPDDVGEYPDWLAAAAEESLRALRSADPETPMWSPGADQHVRFYARRLLFEAVVHLADAELALGRAPRVEACAAADGIEEFLENLPFFVPVADRVAELGRDGGFGQQGASLRLCATDTGAAWTVVLGGEGGFRWENTARDAAGRAPVEAGSGEAGRGDAAVTVAGPAGELLLLVYGRREAGGAEFTVRGDRVVLDAWLAATVL